MARLQCKLFLELISSLLCSSSVVEPLTTCGLTLPLSVVKIVVDSTTSIPSQVIGSPVNDPIHLLVIGLGMGM